MALFWLELVSFWATICKMVCPMLWDRCAVCSVYLQCWCIVAKRLGGSRYHLVRR